MFRISHPGGVTPMLVASSDRDEVNAVLDTLWESSTSLGDCPREDATLEEAATISLDPGGMIQMNAEMAEFDLEGIQFTVPACKAYHVPDLIERGKERVPGWWRFPIWHWFVFVPLALKDLLIEKLDEIVKSDLGLEESLDHELMRKKLEDAGAVIRADVHPDQRK